AVPPGADVRAAAVKSRPTCAMYTTAGSAAWAGSAKAIHPQMQAVDNAATIPIRVRCLRGPAAFRTTAANLIIRCDIPRFARSGDAQCPGAPARSRAVL